MFRHGSVAVQWRGQCAQSREASVDVVVEKDRRIESIAEACNMLKLSRSKLYDLVDEGKLHRVKIGHR